MLAQVSRELLRPISITDYKVTVKGYFHGFSTAGDVNDGIGPVAIVEFEDGSVTTVDVDAIKFQDVSEE